MKISKKVKNILERAIKTFLEGFLSALAVNLSTGLEISKSVLIGALAMGLSALINYIQSLLNKEEGK